MQNNVAPLHVLVQYKEQKNWSKTPARIFKEQQQQQQRSNDAIIAMQITQWTKMEIANRPHFIYSVHFSSQHTPPLPSLSSWSARLLRSFDGLR